MNQTNDNLVSDILETGHRDLGNEPGDLEPRDMEQCFGDVSV